jgi:hypothetical protein
MTITHLTLYMNLLKPHEIHHESFLKPNNIATASNLESACFLGEPDFSFK